MLAPWFSRPQNSGATTPSGPPTNRTTPKSPEPDEGVVPRKRAVTTALSNPHDAVLAELYEHHPDVDTSPKIDANPTAENQQPIDTPLRARDLGLHLRQQGMTSVSVAPTFSTHTTHNNSPVPGGDILYDPFSGATLGMLTQDERTGRDEELWAHLSRVLELQSEVASMHMQMEGIGETRSNPDKERVRLFEDEEVEMGETEAAGDEEAERGKRREEGFINMSKSFESRKSAIDGVMNKLDDLSQALTTFHALRTPTIEFSNQNSRSRSSTNNIDPSTRNVSTTPSLKSAPKTFFVNKKGEPEHGRSTDSPKPFQERDFYDD